MQISVNTIMFYCIFSHMCCVSSRNKHLNRKQSQMNQHHRPQTQSAGFSRIQFYFRFESPYLVSALCYLLINCLHLKCLKHRNSFVVESLFGRLILIPTFWYQIFSLLSIVFLYLQRLEFDMFLLFYFRIIDFMFELFIFID